MHKILMVIKLQKIKNYFFFLSYENKNSLDLFSFYKEEDYYNYFIKNISDFNGYIVVQVNPYNIDNLLVAFKKIGLKICTIISLVYTCSVDLDRTTLDRKYSLCVVASKEKNIINKLFKDAVIVNNIDDQIIDYDFLNNLFRSTYAYERENILLKNNEFILKNTINLSIKSIDK